MQEARFYKKLGNKTVQCQLCNHYCVLKEGALGLCRARQNKGGKLHDLVYGYPVALNVDPVEKKPLYHFLPGSTAFSLGTYGCNFRCKNCQNYDISQATNIEEKNKQLKYFSPEEIVKLALEYQTESIAYTYVEPTIFGEYALDIMKIARKNNLKNIWISNGYMSKNFLQEAAPLVDAFNIDLKSFDDDFYQKIIGARLKPVLDNLKRIKKLGNHLEVTTLVIPTLSDDLKMLKKIIQFIHQSLGADTPWHISRFSGEISWQLKNLPSTKIETLEKIYNLAKKAGLKYVYLGNVPGKGENTYCPYCGTLAIKRTMYSIERFDKNGHCPQCGKDLNIITD